MLLSGDYITPQFCKEIFFDKPPFLYWLIAISMRVFGAIEAAARLPSAMAGVAIMLLTVLFARRRYGNRAGFLAGAILLTCPLFWSFSRQAMSDAWLTLCVSAALFAYHNVLRSDHPWKTSLIVGHVFLATSLLVKGPVGIVLTGLPVLGALFFCPRARWKRFLFPPGILVFLLVAIPWYFAVAWKHGSFFWNYFIFRENVGRFLGSSYQTSHETYVYYPVILLKHAFPWALWLPACIRMLYKSRHIDSEQGFTSLFLFLWIATPILFFSISRFQIYYYVLPCFPAIAIIVGAGLSRYAIQPLKRFWKSHCCIPCAVSCCSCICFLEKFDHAFPRYRMGRSHSVSAHSSTGSDADPFCNILSRGHLTAFHRCDRCFAADIRRLGQLSASFALYLRAAICSQDRFDAGKTNATSRNRFRTGLLAS